MAQSVSRVVQEILSTLSYLGFAFEHHLVNESALARFIHKRVEEKVGAPVSRGSIVAAVRRFIISYRPRQKHLNLIHFLKSIRVLIRTGMVEANLKRTQKTADLLSRVSKKTRWDAGEKFYALPRSQEITIVTNVPKFKDELRKLSRPEILSFYEDRAVITVSYDPETEEKTFGALHFLSDVFASLGITIHVVFSTYSENSFVIKEKDVPTAYKLLSQSVKEVEGMPD